LTICPLESDGPSESYLKQGIQPVQPASIPDSRRYGVGIIFPENTQIAHNKTGCDGRKHAREPEIFCQQKRTVSGDRS
jgi:hypothetical protein